MHKFEEGAALVIAGDLRSTFAATDEAIASGSRLFGTIVDTVRASGLDATESQRLYGSVAAGLQSVVEGRGQMVDAMKRMTVLKRHSNLDVVDIGCGNPLETFTGASLSPQASPVAAA